MADTQTAQPPTLQAAKAFGSACYAAEIAPDRCNPPPMGTQHPLHLTLHANPTETDVPLLTPTQTEAL